MIGQEVTIFRCKDCRNAYIKIGHHQGGARHTLKQESKVESDSLIVQAEWVQGIVFPGREVRFPLTHECKS